MTTPTELEYARNLKWARSRGIKVVPVVARSKASAIAEYAKDDYEPPADSLWLTEPGKYSLGFKTGTDSGNLVDIDLDCAEAVFFARHFLPRTTAVFGRASKPRSHYLYRVPEGSIDKFAVLDPVAEENKKTMLEFRGSGGHQTVAPPSIHESGEQIRWETSDPELAEVSYSDLRRAMYKVAMATLLVRYVWLEGQRNEMTKHVTGMLYAFGWPVEEACEFFEALLEYTEDDDKTRLMTVKGTYSKAEKGSKITGGPVLKKLLKDGDALVSRMYDWFGNGNQGIVEEFNERFAVVSMGNKYRIAWMEVERGATPALYAKEDFVGLFGNQYVVGDDGKNKSKAFIWLSSDRRTQYRDVTFIPGKTQEQLNDEGNGCLNLWTGWSVEPDPNASCAAWLELVWRVLAGQDEEYYKWLLNWFCGIIRDPLRKPGTVPVLIGRPGAGKTMSIDYFGRILGDNYVPVTNPEHIYGKFNAHLGTCMLLHSEEALYGGEKKHLGIIKSLATDRTFMFERKGVDPRPVPSTHRLIMSSNNERAAPVEEEDRRFTIFHLKDRRIGEDLKLRVLAERRNNGPGALLHYFLHVHDYQPELCLRPILNDDLQEAKDLNASPVTLWWRDKLETGELIPGWLGWAVKPINQSWPQEVMSKALFELFRHERPSDARFHKEVLFWNEMKKFFGVDKMSSMKQIRRYTRPDEIDPQFTPGVPSWVMVLPNDQRTQALVSIPSVEDCRAIYEQRFGITVEWPAIEEEKIPNHIEKYMKKDTKRPSY